MKNKKNRTKGIWICSLSFIVLGTILFLSALEGFKFSGIPENLNEFPIYLFIFTKGLIGVLLLTIGGGIFFLKNWARLISYFLGLIIILSSFVYLLPRPGMELLMKFRYLKYCIIVILWSGMGLCSILIPLLTEKKYFRRTFLFGIILLLFLIILVEPYYWCQAEALVIFPYLIIPVTLGLVILVFFTNSKVKEQFKK